MLLADLGLSHRSQRGRVACDPAATHQFPDPCQSRRSGDHAGSVKCGAAGGTAAGVGPVDGIDSESQTTRSTDHAPIPRRYGQCSHRRNRWNFAGKCPDSNSPDQKYSGPAISRRQNTVMDNFDENDLQNVWQNQETENLTMSRDQLQELASRLKRRMNWGLTAYR